MNVSESDTLSFKKQTDSLFDLEVKARNQARNQARL